LEDLSGQHHTGEYIAGIINNVIQRIGKEKIAAIVSDNGSNVRKARELVTTQYQSIINVKCIAHCINLILHDIISHQFTNRLVRWANILVKYFKTSHIGGHLLRTAMEKAKIEGGNLKTYVQTRWMTIYECTLSIVWMKSALEYVSIRIEFEFITNYY